MKLKCKIVQKFKGNICGAIIENQMVYNTTEYLMELIDEYTNGQFNFSEEFVKDVACAIEGIYLGSDLTFEDIERVVGESIRETSGIEDLLLDRYRDIGVFEHIDDKLARGEYFR